jgi:hypothetical protein
VLELLGGIASGAIPLTHDGLTAAGRGKHISHLRSLLEHHGLLPPRDEHLARFEQWLSAKLGAIASPAVRAPVEQFATWHHLRRLRGEAKPGQSSDRPKRSAKQEITKTIKFLTWLEDSHGRTAADCTQHDVDAYLTSGPTTRHLIRTFFVWAKSARSIPACRSHSGRPEQPPRSPKNSALPGSRNCSPARPKAFPTGLCLHRP